MGETNSVSPTTIHSFPKAPLGEHFLNALKVTSDALVRRTVKYLGTVFKNHYLAAQTFHCRHLMADKDHGPLRRRNIMQFAKALSLEARVTDGQHLIHN